MKKDVLEYQQKGRVVLLGDFNARVGKSTDVDDVIGSFGEKWNNFLNELILDHRWMVYIGMARYISHVRCINNAL